MKRALVLGGGGMYGAFQAGVYKALYGRVHIDCAIGASAGSLNAWAIAAGMPPAELEAMWLKAGESAKLRLRFPLTVTGSIIDTAPLEAQVREMVTSWPPRMEIGVVVSQGAGLRQVLYRNESIDADVLLASCAVPLLLPAKRIAGKLSVDGGLRNSCPEWTAREMGATEIVAVDVWTHLPWWWIPRKAKAPATESGGVLRIQPPEALGPLHTSAVWNRERVIKWIELGRKTAEALLERK